MSYSEKTIIGDASGNFVSVNEDGSLKALPSGFQSPTSGGNSTTIATDSFTGTWETNTAPDVQVSCYSDDQAGTLHFDFSPDGGTNTDTFPSSGFSVAAGVHEFHTAVKGPRSFRVRWSSSVAPTNLRIYVYYGQFRQPSSPLNQPLGLDSDAVLVRPTWPWLDVARGLQTGVTSVKKFGRNDSVGTSYSPVALGGVYQTPQSGSATTLRIKAGGNANDTAAGTGAREVTLIGTDENFLEVSETLATAGASASSATTTTFTRLYRAFVSESGTYATAASGAHAGDIVVENGAGGTDWCTIDSDSFPKSQTEIGAFTIPAGKTGYVKLRDLSIDSGKTVDLVFFSRQGADETAAPYTAMRAQSVVSGVTGGSIETFGEVDVPFGPYTGPTDVGFMSKVSTGSASVSVEFEIFILDE